jgi:hypothetical protein
MKTIKIAKFDPLHQETAEDTVISITEDNPGLSNNDHRSMKDMAVYYEDQADLIADALYNSLPQGTFDRLVIKLLQHKTSLYRGKTES